MRKCALIASFILPLIFLVEGTSEAHDHTTAEFHFQVVEGKVYVKAFLLKEHITRVLMLEGDCPPRDMIKVCGDEYLQEHFRCKVNGVSVGLKQLAVTLEKSYIIIDYELDATFKSVDEIQVENSYMLLYDDHAVCRIKFSIDDVTKQYITRQSRQTIYFKSTIS